MPKKPDLDDLRSFLLPWATDTKLTDAALADLCRQLATELLDTSNGSPLPARPTTGIVCYGANSIDTRQAMWWRGVVLERDQEVFAGEAHWGSYWAAEFLAILDAFEWADDSGYEGTIWTTCETIHRWWHNREFLCNHDLPDAVRRRIEGSLSLKWPLHRLQFWDRNMWGDTPADYARGTARTGPDQEPSGKRKRRRRTRVR